MASTNYVVKVDKFYAATFDTVGDDDSDYEDWPRFVETRRPSAMHYIQKWLAEERADAIDRMLSPLCPDVVVRVVRIVKRKVKP